MIWTGRYSRWLAWVAVCLGTVLNGAALAASGGQPLELNIQLIPGIWINGSTGAVNIEYTTNLDQTTGWAMLATVQATNSPYFYIDASATNAAKRFYRAVVEGVNPDPERLVWLNSGTFLMGSPTNEVDRVFDEGPRTQVTISKGFWMSKYETTQAEYLAVMGSNPSFFTTKDFVGNPISPDLNRPVEMVSWFDATNYCGKLTARERNAGRLPAGYVYRLPTEAEWEYACRAGTTTRFSYGDDLNYTSLKDYAWYGGRGNSTHPVGGKLPNAWGLYDMYGNVYEWCQDWYGTYPGGSVVDPRGPNTGSFRGFRGGSWINSGAESRTAGRNNDSPGNGYAGLGFRPVLAPSL